MQRPPAHFPLTPTGWRAVPIDNKKAIWQQLSPSQRSTLWDACDESFRLWANSMGTGAAPSNYPPPALPPPPPYSAAPPPPQPYSATQPLHSSSFAAYNAAATTVSYHHPAPAHADNYGIPIQDPHAPVFRRPAQLPPDALRGPPPTEEEQRRFHEIQRAAMTEFVVRQRQAGRVDFAAHELLDWEAERDRLVPFDRSTTKHWDEIDEVHKRCGRVGRYNFLESATLHPARAAAGWKPCAAVIPAEVETARRLIEKDWAHALDDCDNRMRAWYHSLLMYERREVERAALRHRSIRVVTYMRKTFQIAELDLDVGARFPAIQREYLDTKYQYISDMNGLQMMEKLHDWLKEDDKGFVMWMKEALDTAYQRLNQECRNYWELVHDHQVQALNAFNNGNVAEHERLRRLHERASDDGMKNESYVREIHPTVYKVSWDAMAPLRAWQAERMQKYGTVAEFPAEKEDPPSRR
ncbi:hypothetical protein EXIGLDRAFT_763483 [Exidia glandulosa HHB12029]|uniref:Uncharacterized protein n=1 Tax=Exidia glandulosa HHB12029 TaxID=1314781 RepID=A0A165LXW6_EXIGL|nr:hypothetical protein EXIGLDRAFT_763483 [Exidia glandulosa HHB12029]